MKYTDWLDMEVTTGGEKLPAGAYVIRITDVEDVPGKSYAWFTYDIAEGPHAGHYDNEWGRTNDWAHRFTRFYREDMFKGGLGLLSMAKAIKGSNPAWNWSGDTADLYQFIGQQVGVLFSTEQYTNNKGEDKERLTVDGMHTVQEVREGKTKEPRVIDNREKVEAPAAAPARDAVYTDVPF